MDRINAMRNGWKAQVPAPLNPAFSFNWGGDKEFMMETKAKLGAKAIGRRELANNEEYELKGPQGPYNRVFGPKKCSLRLENDYFWKIC